MGVKARRDGYPSGSSGCQLQQPFAGRIGDGRCTRADVEPGQDIGYVAVDRVPAQNEAVGYLLVAQAPGYQRKYFLLARGEKFVSG